MNTLLKSAVVACVVAVAGFFIHPFGPVRDQSSDRPLLLTAQVSPAAERVFERSCQNCHSERTEWPWYSYAPPVSWLIEADVAAGRQHMNLSHWDTYTTEQKIDLLTKMSVEVRNHRMPLPKYLAIHPEANLSDGDIVLLNGWAHDERRRLKTQ